MTMVTRRAALKCLAVSAMAPLVELRPAIDRERLLAAFCDTGGTRSIRFDLAAPFAVGSLTYATDALSMCRAEIANRWEIGERRLPPIEKCWDRLWKPARRFELYSLPPIDTLTLGDQGDYGVCPLCDGRRKSLGSAYPDGEWCDSLEAHLRYYDVDDNTTLDPACQLCHGRLYAGPWQVRVCGVLMSYSRMKAIAALPEARVSRTEVDGGALLFAAAGFEGVAMGMHQ